MLLSNRMAMCCYGADPRKWRQGSWAMDILDFPQTFGSAWLPAAR
jgi:hypothetical protein